MRPSTSSTVEVYNQFVNPRFFPCGPLWPLPLPVAVNVLVCREFPAESIRRSLFGNSVQSYRLITVDEASRPYSSSLPRILCPHHCRHIRKPVDFRLRLDFALSPTTRFRPFAFSPATRLEDSSVYCEQTQLQMRIMPRKPFRKSSLLTRCRECFFGFADSAKEEYFTRLQVECRTFPIVLLSLAYCASSITKIMAPEHSHEHVMERILLEPLTPVPAVCLASAALLGRWRWVEPLTIICSIMRHLTLMLWLMCDPASAPPVVGRFHFLVSLMWMLSVPSMVNRSPADISPWPVIVIRTPHSASPVVPNQPKLAGGPNPSSFIQDLWHSFSSLPLSNLKTRFTAILGFLLVPTTLLCLFLKVSPCILSWLFAMYFVCYLLPWLLNIHLVLRRQLRVGSFLLADKKPM
eukprot:gene11711-34438_t